MLEFRQDDIDPRAGVEFTARLPTSGSPVAWKAPVEALVKLHERFVAAGGLGERLEDAADNAARPRLIWTSDGFVIVWDWYARRPMDLVVLLRILDRLRVHDEPLASVELRGRKIAADPSVRLPRLLEWLSRSIPFRERLHVALEFQPMGSWVNLECRLPPHVDQERRAELDTLVALWSDIANAGGFQTDRSANAPEEEFGVALSEAADGDDFLYWSMQTLNIPTDSLTALVNLLDAHTVAQDSLTLVSVS